MTTSVFISYSRNDQEVADQLYSDINGAGHDVWMDREKLAGGQNWISTIYTELERCDLMVLLLSPEAVDSYWVKEELGYFLVRKKPVIPVLLRPTEFHADFNALRTRQILDFTGGLDRERTQSLLDAAARLAEEHDQGSHGQQSKPSDRAVYVEDAREFLAVLPRRLLWRVMGMGRSSRLGSMFIALMSFIVRPISVVGMFFTVLVIDYLVFTLVVGLLPGVSFAALLSAPIWHGFMFALAGLGALIYVPLRPWLVKNLFAQFFPQLHQHLPHRPLKKNYRSPLSENWGQIEPIIEALLDMPILQWREYIDRKCPDPALRSIVDSAALLLVGLPRE